MRRLTLISVACCTAVVLVAVLALALVAPALAGRAEASEPQQPASGDTISIADARSAADAFLTDEGYTALVSGDVMEFSNNFFVLVASEDTGASAMELVVSLDGAVVHPAPGPSMMWNTAYDPMGGTGGQPLHEAMMLDMRTSMMSGAGLQHGMMGDSHDEMASGQQHEHGDDMSGMMDMTGMVGAQGMMGMHDMAGMQDMTSMHDMMSMRDMAGMYDMMSMHDMTGMTGPAGGAVLDEPLDAELATAAVQAWLDAARTGLTTGDLYQLPGYFTFVTLDVDGQQVGLVSINASDGQVWEHTWHGTFVQIDSVA